MSNKNLDINDDLQIIVTAQRRELMAAEALESDLDLAFDLQLQEAINASLSLTPSTSSSPPPPPPPPAPSKDEVSVATFQSEELSKFEQEARDRKKCAQEFERVKEDLHRRIHDQNFARDVLNIPEDEWIDTGDYFERPYGEGSSGKSGDVGGGGGEIFRIYFKGLVSEERVRDSKTFLAGIGVAICDSRDHVVFEMRKPLVGSGTNKQAAEFRALIEGLNAALALDIKRLTFFVDYYPIFQFLMRRWPPKQRKIATLVNQVFLIQNKFIYCNPTLVARNDVKFAFKLAREAIVSQLAVPSELSSGKTLKENCLICLEDTDIGQMFSVDGCLHRYCFSCMKQHVEVKLLHGIAPKCPHEGCKSELHINSCKKFLTPKLIDMMVNRIKEASIPITEKVYCPYPRCSALMSKSEIEVHNGEDGLRRCKKCNGLFCVNCKVPWHHNMTCTRYRRLNPQPQDDAKLKSLATRNLWRQCVRCNHMIELAEGCYHMTCRCGYEFCYTCGAEWKNKKATCSCPLWDEENILHNDEDDEDDFNLDEDEYEEYFESDSDDYY